MRRGSATRAVTARVAAAVLQLASLAAVARLLGADALGTAVTYYAVTRLTGTVCSLGLPYWLLRELPRVVHRAEQRQVVARAAVLTGAVTLSVGALAGVVLWALDALAAHTIVLGVTGSAFAAVGRVVSGALKGMGEGTYSIVAEFAGPPVVTLAGTVGLTAMSDDPSRGPLLVVLVVGSAVATALMLHRLGLTERASWRRGAARLPARHDWLSFAASGMLGVALVDVPPLVVSATLGVAEAGALGVAQRMLSLPTLIIVGASTMYAPRFSRAWHDHDGSELRRQFRSSQLFIAAPLVPPLLGAIAVPAVALLPFGGTVDGAAHDVVRVLAAAQLVNAVTGLGPDLLLMSAHARSEVRWTALALVVTIATCLATAALGAGLVGFGLAVGLGMAVRNVGCYANAQEVMRHAQANALHG